MLFGLTNVSAIFQVIINNVLKEYLDIFVIVYLDDILVYLKNKKKHVKYVKTMLKAL